MLENCASTNLISAKTATPGLWLPALVFLATLASSSQVPSSIAEIKFPDLNLILQRLEDVQHQDPAQSRPYEVAREYKVFRGDDKQPTSEAAAQINFVPPDMKTYKITQARGNSIGERIVRELLDRESESAQKGRGSEIIRTTMTSCFLGKRTSVSSLSTFADRPQAEGKIPLKRADLGRCEHFPYPPS